MRCSFRFLMRCSGGMLAHHPPTPTGEQPTSVKPSPDRTAAAVVNNLRRGSTQPLHNVVRELRPKTEVAQKPRDPPPKRYKEIFGLDPKEGEGLTPEPESDGKNRQGTCYFWFVKKTFGFIIDKHDDAKVFVHQDEIKVEPGRLRILSVGEHCMYDREKRDLSTLDDPDKPLVGEGNWTAKNVRHSNGGPLPRRNPDNVRMESFFNRQKGTFGPNHGKKGRGLKVDE